METKITNDDILSLDEKTIDNQKLFEISYNIWYDEVTKDPITDILLFLGEEV